MIRERSPRMKRMNKARSCNSWTRSTILLLAVTSLLLTLLPSAHTFSPAATLRNRVTPTESTHGVLPEKRLPGTTTPRFLASPGVENGLDEGDTTTTDTSPPSSNIRVEKMDAPAEAETLPLADRIARELALLSESASLTYRYVIRTKLNGGGPSPTELPQTLVQICDDIDSEAAHLASLPPSHLALESVHLRKSALELSRYHLLVKLMKDDYPAYVATASFLSPSRIPRLSLPNAQDVPLDDIRPSVASADPSDILVDDCTLDDVAFTESLLDRALLALFRFLVRKNTGGVTSDLPGINGLLEQGRKYMLAPNQTDVRQHDMVKETLADLMTPFLPPFYRVFMAGIVPPGLNDAPLIGRFAGRQLGPWFYAPWLTTMVTPVFFGFLVGPSYPNRRKDGERGGLVVEKCKFLQESGCKGLCLNICKVPTQEFFRDELGLDLTVSPNFATQECQWSFGEVPLPPEEDPSFPRGCLVGCQSRAVMAETYADTRGSCS